MSEPIESKVPSIADFPRLQGDPSDEAAHPVGGQAAAEPQRPALGMSFAQAHHAQRNAGRVNDISGRPAQALAQKSKQAAAPSSVETKGEAPAAAGKGAAAAASVRTKSGRGMVKAVLTGDTLVLMGSAPPGQTTAPEKVISLSGISAPRVARGKNGTEEPFGWASREVLRRKCIGQMASFSINYTHEASGHEYGVVTVNDENLAEFMVASGWATAKSGPKGKDGKLHPDRQGLVELEEKARAEEVGMFNPEKKNSHVRSLEWVEHASPTQARQLADQYKGKVVNAVVDRVLDGDTLRLEIIPEDDSLKHTMITLHLAGVLCPHMPIPFSVIKERYERELINNPNAAREPPKEEAPPPYAVAARDFTEVRLLNRDVGVSIRAADKTGNLFGSIHFSKGSIAAELIRNGLAQFVAWSAAMLPQAEQQQLRQAETEAKRRGVNLYGAGTSSGANGAGAAPISSHTAAPARTAAAGASVSGGGGGGGAAFVPGKTFNARVVQVLAGDLITVQDSDTDEERKVYMASVSAPRLGNPRRNIADEPWAYEAKEFMRKRLIGRKIKGRVDYIRGAPPNANEKSDRIYVTIYYGKNNNNILEELVEEGLATVQKHRVDDLRSVHYDALLAAEQKAEHAKKCIHSKQKAPNHSCLDLSERYRVVGGENKEQAEGKQRVQSAKARTFHSAMKSDKGVAGVVEYIFTGSRLKVYVPRENIMVSFILSGVRCPAPTAPSGSGRKSEPFGDEAMRFTRNNCMQRDVKLEVEAIDRGDNFIGTLRYGQENTNLAVELLKNGLAEIYSASADRSPYRDVLLAAEASAKESKLGMWHNWTPPKPEENKEAAGDEQEAKGEWSGQSLNVRVTEVVDASNFFVQLVGTDTLKFITDKMASFEEKAAPVVPVALKKGQTCAGRFSDGKWHRVKVEGRASDGQWRVFFVDYGNRDVLSESDLRPIGDSSITSVPPLAVSCTLAAIKAPASGSEYFDAAVAAFTDMCYERDMVAKVILRDPTRRLHVTLHHPELESSVNELLLEQGLARLQNRVPGPVQGLAQQYREVEQAAKDSHANIWEYGDVSDPEDAQEDPVGPSRRR